jgi:hypothetical protein
MMEHGRLVRYEVHDAGVPTARGVGVGSTEDAVLAAYAGEVTVLPHKYDAGGRYLVVPGPDDLALVFETDGVIVTTYRAGEEPAVSYVEGCG